MQIKLRKQHRQYSQYKDTGIPWLGEVPENWEAKKLKFLGKIVLGKMLQDKPQDNYELKPYLRSQNIRWEKVDVEDTKEMYFSKTERKKYLLQKNDLLVSEGGDVGRTCLWGNELEECYIQNSVNRVRIFKENNPRFVLYQFIAFGAGNVFFENVNKVSIAHLTKEKLKEFSFSLPLTQEQTAIADYLDEKTTLLDRIISAKQKQIELLKEKRTSLINRAVTRGIDENAEMKESGVEWIGEIPKGWEVRKLKYCSKINNSSLPENTNPEYEIRYLDIGNVKLGEVSENPEEYLFENAPSRARRRVKNGVTIIGTVRTYLKAIAYLEKPDKNLIVSTGFAVIEGDKEMNDKFLYFFLRSEIFVNKVMAFSKGVSYPAINSSDIGNLCVVIPSLKEQEKIVAFLDSETQKIDQALGLIEKSIALLEEYKISLISRVVTGKVKIS